MAEEALDDQQLSLFRVVPPWALQRLFDQLPRAVAVVGRSGTVAYRNPAMAEQFGVRAGMVLAQIIDELAEPLKRVLYAGEFHSAAQGQSRGWEWLADVTPISLGEFVVGALCLVEEAGAPQGPGPSDLDQLIRERDAIIDFSSAGLWICDGDGYVLRVNPTGAQLNGVDPAEVVGRHMSELVARGDLDRSVTLEVIRTRARVDMILRTREGRKIVSSGHPVLDEEGRLFRVVATERDVTESEELQARLEEEEARLNGYRSQMVELQKMRTLGDRFLARGPGILGAFERAMKVSRVDSTVLLLGESGVGKSLVAELIHETSDRADQPFIRVNCGAIPESLIESELYGYEKGAFTGALASGKPGLIELAQGGTLFLDEVAELSLAAQVKLLRFLEDGKMMRLGATASIQVDSRVIVATNRNLEEMVANGRFRSDLYYRLNVIPIRIPPLRERRECLPLLLQHYIDRFGKRLGRKKNLSPAALELLLGYAWPGNVRELINICERLVVLSEDRVLEPKDIPSEVIGTSRPRTFALSAAPTGKSLRQIADEAERGALLWARTQCRNQSEMAALLDVTQPTIGRKLKKHGLAP